MSTENLRSNDLLPREQAADLLQMTKRQFDYRFGCPESGIKKIRPIRVVGGAYLFSRKDVLELKK